MAGGCRCDRACPPAAREPQATPPPAEAATRWIESATQSSDGSSAFALTDHAVGLQQHGRRDLQPDGLGCLEIHHQLEIARLLDREFARLRAMQDAVDEVGK